MLLDNMNDLCKCGHTYGVHTDDREGPCLGYNGAARCACPHFTDARTVDPNDVRDLESAMVELGDLCVRQSARIVELEAQLKHAQRIHTPAADSYTPFVSTKDADRAHAAAPVQGAFPFVLAGFAFCSAGFR